MAQLNASYVNVCLYKEGNKVTNNILLIVFDIQIAISHDILFYFTFKQA